MSLIGRWLVLIRLSEMMNGLRLIWNSVFGFQCTDIQSLCQWMFDIGIVLQGTGFELRRIFYGNSFGSLGAGYVMVLDSSMVEHAAVNRGVVGSSPTRGGCP